MKCIKKPIEVDFIEVRRDNMVDVYEFIHGRKPDNQSCKMAENAWYEFELKTRDEGWRLKTLESDNETQVAIIGVDNIIKGVDGEVYPIKRDIFNRTYDVFEE